MKRKQFFKEVPVNSFKIVQLLLESEVTNIQINTWSFHLLLQNIVSDSYTKLDYIRIHIESHIHRKTHRDVYTGGDSVQIL